MTLILGTPAKAGVIIIEQCASILAGSQDANGMNKSVREEEVEEAW